jgi:heat-inducible transcriptional repressor
MKLSKREIILESIIKEYLKSKSPIGSSELQGRMTLNISPSTIRIYFKRLSEEGSLVQLHVSSGRVPTEMALRNYWESKIETKEPIKIYDINRVQNSIRDFGLYCMLKKSKNSIFKELINASSRYLILVFDDEEVVLKYHKKVETFLNDFIGYSMKDLKKIASSVGLFELHNKLNAILLQEALLQEGINELYDIAQELNDETFIQRVIEPNFLDSLDTGIYFDDFVPSGCMAVKQEALINEEALDMFCLGRLDSDFESFFNNTKE